MDTVRSNKIFLKGLRCTFPKRMSLIMPHYKNCHNHVNKQIFKKNQRRFLSRTLANTDVGCVFISSFGTISNKRFVIILNPFDAGTVMEREHKEYQRESLFNFPMLNFTEQYL